jgi:redox-sensing transcriptional repressor
MKAEKVSELTTNRLSVYLRCLTELSRRGVRTISSAELAKRFHLNSAQIRKDLTNFGEFGVRGVGYDVEHLRDHLIRILGLDKQHRVAIIGSGRLGMALAHYYGFKETNFEVVALFDSAREKVGTRVDGIEVFDIKDFSSVVKRDKIEVAVIAVPASDAQQILELVVDAGIRAVMNFAPVPLRVIDEVKLKTVDLTTSLESLAYFLAGAQNTNGKNPKPNSTGRRK